MHPLIEYGNGLTRRQFFGSTGLRCGSLAMALMAAQSAARGEGKPAVPRAHPPLPGFPHHKPRMRDFYDRDLPESIRNGQRLTTMTSGQGKFPVAPSKFKFAKSGKCGTWVNSELLPHTAEVVDHLAVVKTVHTNAINHDPACTFVMTGSEVPG